MQKGVTMYTKQVQISYQAPSNIYTVHVDHTDHKYKADEMKLVILTILTKNTKKALH